MPPKKDRKHPPPKRGDRLVALAEMPDGTAIVGRVLCLGDDPEIKAEVDKAATGDKDAADRLHALAAAIEREGQTVATQPEPEQTTTAADVAPPKAASIRVSPGADPKYRDGYGAIFGDTYDPGKIKAKLGTKRRT